MQCHASGFKHCKLLCMDFQGHPVMGLLSWVNHPLSVFKSEGGDTPSNSTGEGIQGRACDAVPGSALLR